MDSRRERASVDALAPEVRKTNCSAMVAQSLPLCQAEGGKEMEAKYLTAEELERVYGMTRGELVEDMTVRDGRELVCGCEDN